MTDPNDIEILLADHEARHPPSRLEYLLAGLFILTVAAVSMWAAWVILEDGGVRW